MMIYPNKQSSKPTGMKVCNCVWPKKGCVGCNTHQTDQFNPYKLHIHRSHRSSLSGAIALTLSSMFVAIPATAQISNDDELPSTDQNASSHVLSQLSEPQQIPQDFPTRFPIRISGSGDAAHLTIKLGQRFKTHLPGSDIEILSLTVDEAIESLLQGQVDIAAIDRTLTEDELAMGLIAVPLGGGMAYVLNGSIPSQSAESFLNFWTPVNEIEQPVESEGSPIYPTDPPILGGAEQTTLGTDLLLQRDARALSDFELLTPEASDIESAVSPMSPGDTTAFSDAEQIPLDIEPSQPRDTSRSENSERSENPDTLNLETSNAEFEASLLHTPELEASPVHAADITASNNTEQIQFDISQSQYRDTATSLNSESSIFDSTANETRFTDEVVDIDSNESDSNESRQWVLPQTPVDTISQTPESEPPNNDEYLSTRLTETTSNSSIREINPSEQSLDDIPQQRSIPWWLIFSLLTGVPLIAWLWISRQLSPIQTTVSSDTPSLKMGNRDAEHALTPSTIAAVASSNSFERSTTQTSAFTSHLSPSPRSYPQQSSREFKSHATLSPNDSSSAPTNVSSSTAPAEHVNSKTQPKSSSFLDAGSSSLVGQDGMTQSIATDQLNQQTRAPRSNNHQNQNQETVSNQILDKNPSISNGANGTSGESLQTNSHESNTLEPTSSPLVVEETVDTPTRESSSTRTSTEIDIQKTHDLDELETRAIAAEISTNELILIAPAPQSDGDVDSPQTTSDSTTTAVSAFEKAPPTGQELSKGVELSQQHAHQKHAHQTLEASQAEWSTPVEEFVITSTLNQGLEICWVMPQSQQHALQDQQTKGKSSPLILKIFDVTLINLEVQPPHDIQVHSVPDTVFVDHTANMTISLAQGDRDYLAELGYETSDHQWVSLGRSLHVYVPAGETEPQFESVKPEEELTTDLPSEPEIQSKDEPTLPVAIDWRSTTCQTLVINPQQHCYVVDHDEYETLQTTAKTVLLDPGCYIITIDKGRFNYRPHHPEFSGEPLVLLWLNNGRFINRHTNTEELTTFVSLNGYDDVLTIEVLDTTTLAALFFDIKLGDNDGNVSLLILKDD